MHWKKGNKPLISVVMPFYNCENFLDEAISSILNQSFSDFEFIIINDSSTDNSDKIIQKYLYDKRVYYIRNTQNKWIVRNLNTAISKAKWEYIARMDGDDISNKDRLKKQINFLQNNPDVHLVWSFVHLIDENSIKIWIIEKHIQPEQIKKDLFLYSSFVHPTMMIKAKIFKKYKYREKYLYCEDYDLWCRLIYEWYKWANIPEYLLYYRKHKNSSNKYAKIVAKRNFLMRREMIKIYDLELSIKEQLWMYAHFILWVILSWKQKEKLESIVKKIIIK